MQGEAAQGAWYRIRFQASEIKQRCSFLRAGFTEAGGARAARDVPPPGTRARPQLRRRTLRVLRMPRALRVDACCACRVRRVRVLRV